MITIRHVAETVLRVCGRNDLSTELYPSRPGDIRVLAANTDRARELLGYRAEILLEAGIERYVAWFRRTYPNVSALMDDRVENWSMPDSSVLAQ
jgi:UDP-glucose 4-epimerase